MYILYFHISINVYLNKTTASMFMSQCVCFCCLYILYWWDRFDYFTRTNRRQQFSIIEDYSCFTSLPRK